MEGNIYFAETDGVAYNTITPIARMHDDVYEMDLVLRNNITSEESPWGVYHPAEKYHHIKKEDIGLIEVMGLAVLPARLQKEIGTVFVKVLEYAGVYKRTEKGEVAFKRFLSLL